MVISHTEVVFEQDSSDFKWVQWRIYSERERSGNVPYISLSAKPRTSCLKAKIDDYILGFLWARCEVGMSPYISLNAKPRTPCLKAQLDDDKLVSSKNKNFSLSAMRSENIPLHFSKLKTKNALSKGTTRWW